MSIAFYLQVIKALDEVDAPYMIVGAFAAQSYGLTRATFDVDILVDLSDAQIEALAACFPMPRYYADPDMMRDSMWRGLMFNIIDTTAGVKADLVPMTREPDYLSAFARRVRRTVSDEHNQSFEIWCARPSDVIIGKLQAWTEGRSDKHPNDIYQMLFFALSDPQTDRIDLGDIERAATAMGVETLAVWHDLVARAAVDAQKLNNSKGIFP